MISVTHFRPEIKAVMLAIASSIVLVIGMGYGRFAFTGVLPVMLDEQRLTLHQGNLAASANYAGYLLGALLLAKARPTDARLLCIGSVLATIACLAVLGWVNSAGIIIVIRGLAGIFSAVTLIAASLWLLQHMRYANGAPLLYAGVGLGIFISAEFIALGQALALSSHQIWLICAASSALLLLLIIRLLNSPADTLPEFKPTPSAKTATSDVTRSQAFKLLYIYGLCGFGYIITATYLPLFLTGQLAGINPVQVWAVFGLAAVPSCFLWHKGVLKYGYRRSFIANLLLQALGVLLPVFSHTLIFCLASALLVGFTFMGTVTLALPEGKRLAHTVGFNMIAAMTAVFGLGQIAGPLVAGTLFSATGSFNPSLLLATAALVIAAGLVALRPRRPLKADG